MKPQSIVLTLVGVVFGFALYVVPDMYLSLSEQLSFGLKSLCIVVLVIVSIIEVRKKKSSLAAFTITTCLVLSALLIFGGTIRLEELGIL